MLKEDNVKLNQLVCSRTADFGEMLGLIILQSHFKCIFTQFAPNAPVFDLFSSEHLVQIKTSVAPRYVKRKIVIPKMKDYIHREKTKKRCVGVYITLSTGIYGAYDLDFTKLHSTEDKKIPMDMFPLLFQGNFWDLNINRQLSDNINQLIGEYDELHSQIIAKMVAEKTSSSFVEGMG